MKGGLYSVHTMDDSDNGRVYPTGSRSTAYGQESARQRVTLPRASSFFAFSRFAGAMLAKRTSIPNPKPKSEGVRLNVLQGELQLAKSLWNSRFQCVG